MDDIKRRSMLVSHTVRGGKHHVAILPPPWDYDFRQAYYPVDETTAVEALWSGYFEACEYSAKFNADLVTFKSTDSAAHAQFYAELTEFLSEPEQPE